MQKKYTGITLIENAEYQTKNTISSFYAAMDYLQGQNCIISESDLYIADPSIISGTMDKSRYLIRCTPQQDYEWGFLMRGDRIEKVVRPKTGVFLDHHMYGLCYWIKEDLKWISDAVKNLYQQPGHEGMAYDEAGNGIFDKIDVGTIQVNEGQLYEIDCLDDLIKIDSSYATYRSH